jgi:murein L,D-transpeptidase YafK
VVDLKPVTGDQLTVTTVNESVQVENVSQSVPETIIEIPSEPENINETGVTLNQKSAENFLQRWAQAWSNQDVNVYLMFYGENFIPPGGKTRTAWEAQRRIRLTGPKKIMISLDGFQLIPQENNRVRIAVVQSYESDLFVDHTKKVFDLQRTENGWTILRERSLGSIR